MSVHRSIKTPPAAPGDGDARRPFRDNPQFIVVGVLLFLLALVGLLRVADRSTELAPDYLSEVVLYALSAACLTMLVVLGFVLARHIIKLWVERRRAAPFARFRAKLVAALLGMTLIPALLVLIVGGELIRSSAERWFAAPVDDVLTSANAIAREYYRGREAVVAEHAARIAATLADVDLSPAAVSAVRDLLTAEVTARRVGIVDVYRVVRPDAASDRIAVEPVVEVIASTAPQGHARAAAERLAEQVAAGRGEPRRVEPLEAADQIVRAASVIRTGGGELAGVVVASDALTGVTALHARRIGGAYDAYRQLRVLRRPLAGIYLSFFVMITLMILVSATWLGVYVAKRITRPVQLLAAGAREIGAGHLDHRIQPETTDEFGSLVEAFNTMAGELSTSQRRLERSRRDLEHQNLEGDRRRRYTETILERIATGVVSIDADGRVSTVNSAASRLLGLDRSALGQPAAMVFDREDLQPLAPVLLNARSGVGERAAQEVALARDGREIHLAAAATALPGDVGALDGTVMVVDDVTPLIRAERVSTWRDVARRLAHEIKNPLTPIQLCAERMRRHFRDAPPKARELVDECTATIVGEVEALKELVDEFSQFARLPSPRTVPSDLNALLGETLSLYDGLFKDITLERQFATLPTVRLDPEQVRRVVVNLVDNAADALDAAARAASNGSRGVIAVATVHDPVEGVVRLVVADNGPGIAPVDREKLFMPYFSTKRRGSGLGLAIVRRIVIEHGGRIDVTDNTPSGTRVTVELPYHS